MSIHNHVHLTKNPDFRPNILVLGDEAAVARYHPVSSLEASLDILEADATIRIETDYRQLVNREVPFANIDLIINYIDNWEFLDSWEQSRLAARLLIWLAGGGALLTVHNGLITKASPELLQMHGADFTRHDARTVLRFELDEMADPLLAEGFEAYEATDEPYEYRFDTFFEEGFQVWLHYIYQGERRPAAWHRTYGEGHMLYLMPGHDLEACSQAPFKILLRNACRYLLEKQDCNR